MGLALCGSGLFSLRWLRLGKSHLWVGREACSTPGGRSRLAELPVVQVASEFFQFSLLMSDHSTHSLAGSAQPYRAGAPPVPISAAGLGPAGSSLQGYRHVLFDLHCLFKILSCLLPFRYWEILNTNGCVWFSVRRLKVLCMGCPPTAASAQLQAAACMAHTLLTPQRPYVGPLHQRGLPSRPSHHISRKATHQGQAPLHRLGACVENTPESLLIIGLQSLVFALRGYWERRK